MHPWLWPHWPAAGARNVSVTRKSLLGPFFWWTCAQLWRLLRTLCFGPDSGPSLSNMTSLRLVYIQVWPLNSKFLRGKGCNSTAQLMSESDWVIRQGSTVQRDVGSCRGTCPAQPATECGWQDGEKGPHGTFSLFDFSSQSPTFSLCGLHVFSLLPVNGKMCLIAVTLWDDPSQSADTIYHFT